MSKPLDRQDDPRRRPQVAVGGLVIAAVAVLMILPVRRGTDAGFALVVAPLLIASAVALWRRVREALVWGVVLGSLLALMFGAHTVAGFADDGEVGVLLIDIAVVFGGVLTVVGSAAVLMRERRATRGDRSVVEHEDRR